MPYFTTAELRTLPDIVGQVVRFPDPRLVEAHDWIASIVEREAGTSFIVTTVTGERLTGSGTDGLRLPNPYVRTVTAITVDGTAYTTSEVAAVYVDAGHLYLADGYTWPTTSRGNITVTYTYGYSPTPPADLKQAMLRAARNWLLTMDTWSGADVRSTSISNEFGNIQLSVPGERRPTGIPDVDATIMAWADRVRVPAMT